MIITGYQGIGKSTLAKRNYRVIDLESDCFYKYEEDFHLKKTGDKTRPDNWYIYYCQMAQNLSRQGYIVFVSYHQEVRNWLSVHNSEKFCAIFPSFRLKDDWINRLEARYKISNSKKDLDALEHVKECYNNDIYGLWYECQYNVDYYHDVIIIDDINYDLEKLVNDLSIKLAI